MNDLTEFRELGLSEITLEALRVKGFETPSAIQKLAIPGLLSGSHDLIGQAQTGTGKTAAFALPMLETLKRSKKIQALVLSPTRELCLQIAEWSPSKVLQTCVSPRFTAVNPLISSFRLSKKALTSPSVPPAASWTT